MHSIEELGPNVSAFLAKLWKIVEDPETNDLISWNSSGTSFYIRDQARFARELLPLYYKHNNMASFVRQLNMYGFHKVVSIEGGGLRPDKDEMEFAHQCFLMDHPYLVTHIKRKIPVQRLDEPVTTGHPDTIKKVLTDVKGLKGRQDNLNSQLNDMKRENEVLWRELAVLRQKHIKQQQIVNKLIQFLVSMVHNTHTRSAGIGIKRYMLSHVPHNDTPSKHTKANVDNRTTSESSPGGPVIHELDAAELLEECTTTPEEEEEISSSKDFLSSDFCTEPGYVASPNSSTGSMSSLEAAVNTASPEMLLELAEECSLESGLLSSKVGKLKGTTKLKREKKSHSTSGNRKKRLKKIESENVEASSYKESLKCNHLKDVMLPSFTGENIQEEVAPTDADISKAWPSLTKPKEEASEGRKGVVKQEVKEEKNGGGPSPSTSKVGDGNRSASPSLTLSRAVSSDLSRCSLPEELDLHLDSMDSELDTIKELLRGEGYSLDANALLGLFSEDPMAYDLPMPVDSEGSAKVMGSELMAYTPNAPNLDFTDLFGSPEVADWRVPPTPTQEEEKYTDASSYSQINTPLLKNEAMEGHKTMIHPHMPGQSNLDFAGLFERAGTTSKWIAPPIPLPNPREESNRTSHPLHRVIHDASDAAARKY